MLAFLIIPSLLVGCSEQRQDISTSIEVPVSVKEIELGPIEEYVTVTGTVDAVKDYIVKSESAGDYRLNDNPKTKRPFVLGDLVKKDQVIIFLDNPEQENSIRIESQQLNLDIAKSEYEKQQSLYDKGGVTLRELKNAEKSYIDAKYTYENAEMQLAKLKVIAPFDGVIVDLPYYTRGVRISSGTEMVRLMDYAHLVMEVSVPGKLLGNVTVGQPIRVSNYTVPDKLLTGKITQVSPAIDSETRTFKAKAEIDNSELVLRPGMFVKADIIVAKRDSAIVVDKDIILSRRNRKTVFVIDRGFARERAITQGIENPDAVEVVEGLAKGERIVIGGYETLSDGSRVKIVQ